MATKKTKPARKKTKKVARKPRAAAKKPASRTRGAATGQLRATKRPTRKTAARKSAPKRRKKANKKPIGTCFVMMPFKEPFSTYYRSIIRPAVVSASLDPMRGDSLFRSSPIMDDIWKMIQDAKVLVADLTEKNPNVFYELGLAHAIGKPIVLISETMDDVPFDLRPLRVLRYDKDDPSWGNKLKSAIVSALEETLADPAESVPPMFRKRVKSQAPVESETHARLRELERRVNSLVHSPAQGMIFSKVDNELNLARFDIGVQDAGSRREAVEMTMSAIRAGIPNSAIRRVLKKRIPTDEVDPVFDFAVVKVDIER